MSVAEPARPLVDERRRVAATQATMAAVENGSANLDRFVGLVAHLLGYETARVNLVADEAGMTVAAFGAEAGAVFSNVGSVCAAAIRRPGEVLTVADLTRDERFRDDGIAGTYVGAPLVAGDGCVLGTLCVMDPAPRIPTPEAVDTLRRLAEAVTAELEQSRVLVGIARITTALSRATAFAEVHELICTSTVTAAGADGGILLVSDGERLDVVAASERSSERVLLPVGPGTLTGRVCLSGRPEFVGSDMLPPAFTNDVMQRSGVEAVAAYPVGAAGADGAPGVLLVFWRRRLTELPPQVDAVLTVLADQAAVALDRAAMLQRLELLSATDALTGLANVRALEEALERELARARRLEEPVAVAMLGLDHFKAYNDRFGHQAGDQLLRGCAERWSAAVRRTDLVARCGGEEFAVVLPGCHRDAARELIARVLDEVPSGQTCSAGLALWDGTETRVELLGRADRALYTAKGAGRDCIRFDEGE